MKNVKSLVIYINTKFEVNLNSLFTANQDLNSCPKKKRYRSSQECLRLRRLGVKQGPFKRSHDRNDNENVKKARGLINKTILRVHHAFLYISLPSLHDYDVKMSIFTFYSGSTQLSDDEISSFFLNLDMVLRNSTFRRVHL